MKGASRTSVRTDAHCCEPVHWMPIGWLVVFCREVFRKARLPRGADFGKVFVVATWIIHLRRDRAKVACCAFKKFICDLLWKSLSNDAPIPVACLNPVLAAPIFVHPCQRLDMRGVAPWVKKRPDIHDCRGSPASDWYVSSANHDERIVASEAGPVPWILSA